jgi:uncharacterized protein YqjF (DUF2071 family)
VKTPELEQGLSLRGYPSGRSPVMFQRWERLLFLHWEVDAALVQETLPPGLSVDCYEGKAYIGIVPFLMRAIRPRGLPSVPYLSNFLECNVRTYVHDERGKPGVWFYSLDTDRWLAFKIARVGFHLPYYWASMEATVTDRVSYSVRRRGAGHKEARFEYRASGDAKSAEPGSLEFFLLERYLLFAHDARMRRLYSGRVHHEPYQFSEADVSTWDTNPIEWNGLPRPEGEPVHACVASSVDVSVFAIEGAGVEGGKREKRL